MIIRFFFNITNCFRLFLFVKHTDPSKTHTSLSTIGCFIYTLTACIQRKELISFSNYLLNDTVVTRSMFLHVKHAYTLTHTHIHYSYDIMIYLTSVLNYTDKHDYTCQICKTPKEIYTKLYTKKQKALILKWL